MSQVFCIHSKSLKGIAGDVEFGDKDKRVKVRSLLPPVNSDEIKEHLNFKEDYKRFMKRSYDRDPSALRSSLSGRVANSVKDTGRDYDTMSKRLNERFGESCQFVDAEICDLKSVKLASEKDKFFLLVVDKTESYWLCLKKKWIWKEK